MYQKTNTILDNNTYPHTYKYTKILGELYINPYAPAHIINKILGEPYVKHTCGRAYIHTYNYPHTYMYKYLFAVTRPTALVSFGLDFA